MLTNASRYVSPEVEHLINQVIVEDSRYDRELRSLHREKLVLPVNIKFMNGAPPISAFSRNLTVAGTCLITREPVEVQMLAMVQLYRLEQAASQVVGECKWCRPFGPDFYMSGWQFLRLPRQD